MPPRKSYLPTGAFPLRQMVALCNKASSRHNNIIDSGGGHDHLSTYPRLSLSSCLSILCAQHDIQFFTQLSNHEKYGKL